MADLTKHSDSPQSKGSKSLPEVRSKRHKHEWVLIDSYDSWTRKRPELPKGQWVPRGGLFGGVAYIPGFDRQMLVEHIVDEIQRGDEPHFTSETWACHCGERKTNSKTLPSLHASLGLSQQDTRSTEKPTRGKQKNATAAPTNISKKGNE